MPTSKDYYQILGVTPSADLAVIKAVYKALALKFHPDRNKETPDYAAKRMLEINEAYSVLSDEKKRAEYDKSRRGSSEQDQFDDQEEFGDKFNDVEKQIEADWAVAIKYYPDLESILVSLNQVSKSLIIPYKLTLLEKKIFAQRQKLSDQMIDAYLQTYFGKNAEIKEYARLLLKKGRRDAALDLNKAVRVLGSAIDIHSVQSKIENEFNIFMSEQERENCKNGERTKNNAERKALDDQESKEMSIKVILFIIIFISLVIAVTPH